MPIATVLLVLQVDEGYLQSSVSAQMATALADVTRRYQTVHIHFANLTLLVGQGAEAAPIGRFHHRPGLSLVA